MKTKVYLLVFAMLTLFLINVQAQDNKHIVGISYGFQYKTTDIWVGSPHNIWIDQTSSKIVEGFYYYELSKLFQVGAYCDFEYGNFDVFGLPEQKAQRLGLGTLWLGHYPDKWIQFQLGGYFGYNIGLVDYENVDNRSGIDYGIIVGPAVEYNNFGLAVHHHTGFAWYPDKNAKPDEFSYANSKIKIKFYYEF